MERRVRVLRRPQRPERGHTPFWRDAERRRALLLSLLLHLAALLGIVWFYVAPRPSEPENLIVLELATPEESQAQIDAPSVDAPAPQAPLPEIAAGEAGESTASLPTPPAPATPAEAPEDALSEPAPEPLPDPASVAEAPETPEPPPPAPPRAEAPPPPAAQVPAPSLSEALPQLPTQAPSTTLPEIDAVEIAPQPLEEAIALPAPNPQVSVAPARTITVAPQVELADAGALPQPEIQAEVTAATPLPTPEVAASVVTRDLLEPQISTEVTAAAPLPDPEVEVSVATRELLEPEASAQVAAAEPLPNPEVAASVVTRELLEPQVSTEVTAAAPLPDPEVQASVVSREVPQPAASAAVVGGEPLPQPSASASTLPSSPVPQPSVQASLPTSRPLETTPSVQLAETVPLALPEVGVTVAPTLPTPIPSAQAEAPAEGSAPSSAQAQADEDAQTGATGAAASPDGTEVGSASVPQTFNATLEQPLAVLLDNADAAYPQQGLQEATAVYEMPVEGGMTRLMSIYTQGEPTQVGPIRSARDYFLEAALRMNGTLVHVGGAPSTVSRIASQELPTVDALEQASLFSQAPGREAPHSTFAAGTALRDAVGRLQGRATSGILFRPAESAADAAEVTVDFSGDYSSGFRYLSEVDQYRWLRDGTEATGAEGNALVVNAVVVAEVTAVPYPGDLEGRLYLPYEGGEATLYVRGKAVPGRWNPAGGFQFVTGEGEVVDLTPFRHWIMFVPESAEVSAQN